MDIKYYWNTVHDNYLEGLLITFRSFIVFFIINIMAAKTDTMVGNIDNVTNRRRRDPTTTKNISDSINAINNIDLSAKEFDDAPPWGKMLIQLLNISIKSLNVKITETCEIITGYADN